MKALILAAGYGTRLKHLTTDTPKPLLKVGDKPILNHIIDKIEDLDIINKIYIVTNDKFEKNFLEWLENFDAKKPVEIVSDGTKSNEDRLGAIGDVQHTIKTKNIDDDLIIIAGDNLFELSLNEVISIFNKRGHDAIVLYDVKDPELAKNYGVVEVEENIVTNFEEKPLNPRSTLISTGIYLFPRKTLQLIGKYIEQGNNPDKTGSFIEWLHKREKIYAYITEGKWYDIGSLEQLEEANKEYKK
jgi:glucose-1-phosphate thymidylyltransferase|tara:strand:- start:258 stop:989 length:732 start_codon:yes stop_codon:yes gene_type:complete